MRPDYRRTAESTRDARKGNGHDREHTYARLACRTAISSPVLLYGACAMKLTIYGCVVRSNGKAAVVSIEGYEFRTQGSRASQQANASPPMLLGEAN